MSTDESDIKPTGEVNQLTIDELIRSQLDGKSKALERYDQIIWKVRSGYVVVLYGLLTVLAGKDFQLSGVVETTTSIEIALWITVGMSICALLIDLRFLGSKLLVIESRDLLSDVAVDLASRTRDRDQAIGDIRHLLHLSGEQPLLDKKLKKLLILNWPILTLYAVTPLGVGLAWYFSR